MRYRMTLKACPAGFRIAAEAFGRTFAVHSGNFLNVNFDGPVGGAQRAFVARSKPRQRFAEEGGRAEAGRPAGRFER